MSLIGWFQILLFALLVLALTRPLGAYLYRVFCPTPGADPLRRLRFIERAVLRLCGADPEKEQDWLGYALALTLFSAVTLLVTYGVLRLQRWLPLNPDHLAAVPPALAFNTAASFTTNTNWQFYSGETTMSHLSQAAGLAWHNFISAAAGIGVALALARGLTRRAPSHGGEAPHTIGNFWVDLVRALVYVLIPLSIIGALLLVSQGVIQNLSGRLTVTTLEGAQQVLPMGPVASQEAIKQLGTNGGGFFNANSAHPFENPTGFSNLLSMLFIFLIPAALAYTFGRMARDQRQGWALFGAMAVLFAAGVTAAYAAEAAGNPALHGLSIDQAAAGGNLEGKEVRFGVANSALYATVTTDAPPADEEDQPCSKTGSVFVNPSLPAPSASRP